MSKQAAGGNYRHFWSNSRRNCAILAAFGVAGGTGYWLNHRTPEHHAPPGVDAQSRLQQPPTDALKVLEGLRARFESSHPQVQDDTSEAAELASPLLPGLADKFEADAIGYVPHFAANLAQPDARVVLPSAANAPFEIQDLGTGI